MTVSHYPWFDHYDSGVPYTLAGDAQPVFAMMDRTAQDYPDRPALDFLGKRYSWQEIGRLVDRFAAGLQKMGIKKGDHVGLFLPNTPYYLIAYYGILKAGAVVVNFNPLYAPRELSHQIEDSETDVMITLDLSQLYDVMDDMVKKTRLKRVIVCSFSDILPFPKNILFSVFKRGDIARVKKAGHVCWFDDVIDHNHDLDSPVIEPDKDLAVIQYTGGTTGVPKGAMLTHKNVYMNTRQAVSWFPGVEPGQYKMLGVLPFFHVFAMTAIMNFSVLNGFEIIALPRFDLKDALKIIDKKKPHFFPAVPAIYTAINNFKDLGRYDLSSLEYCISGGAPLPVSVKEKFEKITGCVVVEGYGLSETSPVVCVNPVNGDNKAGSIGLPIPDTVVEIIDVETGEQAQTGERGELCVRGPQVMAGYWKNEEATNKTIRNGRLHTGDIAIMDEGGHVFIVDRLKDMIITNGYNVYPRNVEEAIYMHPAVEECIVAGLPDPNRGEIVKTWIKLKNDRTLNAEDLKVFLADKISRMEMPKLIEFRNEPLPKTMIGKLSRKDVVAEDIR